MKKNLSLVVSVLLFIACQESLEQRAQRALRDYSDKNCPMVINESVTLDSCAFDIPTLTLNYYYHLSGAFDNDSSVNAKSGEMRQLLIESLKNETSVRTYKEAGYSFRYIYYSKTEPDDILFETTIKKEDYATSR